MIDRCLAPWVNGGYSSVVDDVGSARGKVKVTAA